MQEDLLINLIKSTLGAESSKHIGDDCAVIEIGSETLVISLDNLVEGTHFTQELLDAYHLGWKSAAVNISDVAAMAAEPLYLLVGLSIPRQIAQSKIWIESFYKGVKAACENSIEMTGLDLPKVIGGDITNSEKIMIAVTVIGKAAEHGVMRRIGAQAGDKVCVTGKFGNSNSYLKGLRDNAENEEYFKRPKARVAAAQNIWKSSAGGALMDASDGLARSLIELSSQNQLRVEINSSKIPKDSFISLEEALYGGEDYELVGIFPQCPEDFIEIGSVKGFFEPSSNYEVHDVELKQDIALDSTYNHFS